LVIDFPCDRAGLPGPIIGMPGVGGGEKRCGTAAKQVAKMANLRKNQSEHLKKLLKAKT